MIHVHYTISNVGPLSHTMNTHSPDSYPSRQLKDEKETTNHHNWIVIHTLPELAWTSNISDKGERKIRLDRLLLLIYLSFAFNIKIKIQRKKKKKQKGRVAGKHMASKPLGPQLQQQQQQQQPADNDSLKLRRQDMDSDKVFFFPSFFLFFPFLNIFIC